MNWIVYALKNPRTNEVRYVGWTSKTMNRRLNVHIQHAILSPTTHRAKWIVSLLSVGLRPVAEVLERGADDGWQEAERRWIAHFKAARARLTNATDGGEGTPGAVRSQEARDKAAAANRGKKRSAEHVTKWHAAARLANIGSHHAPEHRAKIADHHRGKPRSPESVAKTAAGLRNRIFSAESIAKMSAAKIGKKVSPETRAKMSASHKGRPWSAARRAADQKGNGGAR